jgi:ferritin-like metal-binding protein YciE
MKTKKEMLISWLNDAHALELSLVENLEEQSKDADENGKPEAKLRIDEHIEETKNHARMVEECIENLGGEVAKSKDLMGKIMGTVQGKMKSMYKDVMVKDALESYSAEHLEIASYTSIFAAAEELGEIEVAEACEKIIDDEMRMAEWAIEQVSLATKDQLSKMEEGED